MPVNNLQLVGLIDIYMNGFMAKVVCFVKYGKFKDEISLFVSQLEHGTIRFKFNDGNTILSKLFEISAPDGVGKQDYVMKLLLSKASDLDENSNNKTLVYLLCNKNYLGHNLLHHASLRAPVELFRQFLYSTYQLMIKGSICGLDYNQFMMSSTNDGYNELCWLLTLGNAEKLRIYFDSIKRMMALGCLFGLDYHSLLLSRIRVSGSSYSAYSNLNAAKIQFKSNLSFTTFSLTLMALDPSIVGIYIEELQLNLDNQVISKADIISLLLVTNDNGDRLLDLLSLYGSTENFTLGLSLFAQAFSLKLIPKDVYLELLLKNLRPGHSLLHKLVMQHKREKLECYINIISDLLSKGVISESEYLDVFMQKNVHGYTVIHQAINTYTPEISLHVLKSLKDNLSDENYLHALTVRSHHKKGRPLLCHGKLHDAEINQLIADELRETRHRIDSSQYGFTPNYFSFFPSMLLIPVRLPEGVTPALIRR